MIELVQLGRRHGDAPLRAAIEAALALGCHDAAAVRHLLATEELAHQRPEPEAVAVGRLAQYDRPLPEVTAYDQLLLAAAAAGGAR